jgi:hypothetical protein
MTKISNIFNTLVEKTKNAFAEAKEWFKTLFEKYKEPVLIVLRALLACVATVLVCFAIAGIAVAKVFVSPAFVMFAIVHASYEAYKEDGGYKLETFEDTVSDDLTGFIEMGM